MSSHHFVKEGQEPALLITAPADLHVIETLLEWAPLVLVFSPVVEMVLSWGIKADVVICSSAEAEHVKIQMQNQEPIQYVLAEQNSWLVKAIDYLVKKKQTHVNVFTEQPQKLINQSQDFYRKIEISYFNAREKWFAAHQRKFTKWFPASSQISIMSVEPFTAEGNLQIIGDTIFTRGDGIVSITSNTDFWICESLL